jgi:hypothetical protein
VLKTVQAVSEQEIFQGVRKMCFQEQIFWQNCWVHKLTTRHEYFHLFRRSLAQIPLAVFTKVMKTSVSMYKNSAVMPYRKIFKIILGGWNKKNI